MTKHTGPFKLLLGATLLLLVSTWTFANNDPEVEKRKTYSKSYPISSGGEVKLTNQFGEIKINTWDKDEVKVEVTIMGKASTEERAQEIIDRIRILDGKSSGGVWFKTEMENGGSDHDSRKGNKAKGSTSMEINYQVYMPAGNDLDVSNQFGATTLPNLTGEVSIEQKFGDLTAGRLSKVKSLNVEFGSATIESIADCKVTIKFSKAEIKNMSGAIKGNFEFCEVVKLSLTNAVTDLNINNSYSKIEVKVADGFNGDFDIHTSFGEFSNKSGLAIKEKKDEDDDEHGPHFDKDFVGKTGSGGNKVKIKSSFGNIKFN